MNNIKSKWVSPIIEGTVSGILTSVIIAGIALLWQFIYIPHKVRMEDNKFLHQLYVSVSDAYIESKIGEPYISIDNEEIIQRYYLLKDVVLKTISNNGRVVAFFITSQRRNRNIPFNYAGNEIVIGKFRYSDNDRADQNISAFYCGNYRMCYYREFFGMGRSGMYNQYVFSSVPFGFYEDQSTELMYLYGSETKNDISLDQINSIRREAHPNTIGVISAEFLKEVNSILDIEEEVNELDLFQSLDNAKTLTFK